MTNIKIMNGGKLVNDKHVVQKIKKADLNKVEAPPVDLDTVNDLLDKVVLKQLHLIEERMTCETIIESCIHNGSIHLAKTRYIQGHNSISAARLPTDTSPEFSASTRCETFKEDGVKQLKVIENAENTVNPSKWFGLLVPQNLHKAKNLFQNATNYVIKCVNVQLQLQDNMKNIEALKQYKNVLQST